MGWKGWGRCARWVCAVLAVVLAGCGSVPQIGRQQQLSGQDGAVVFRLITNGATKGHSSESLALVHLKRKPVEGEDRYAPPLNVTLSRMTDGTHTTAIFSGVMAPGTYHISHLTGQTANIIHTFPVGEKFGSFEVQPQRVSLLGTLLVQPIENNRFVVGYLPPEDEIKQSFRRLFPAMAAQTSRQEPLTFPKSPELDRRMSFVPHFRQLAEVRNGLAQGDDGGWYAGSKIGQVQWRESGKKGWRTADLGPWREVLTLRPYGKGFIAGGEEGLLYRSEDGGATWQSLVSPEPGAIYVAQPLANGKVLVMGQDGSRWGIHLSEDLKAGKWRTLGTVPYGVSYNGGACPIRWCVATWWAC